MTTPRAPGYRRRFVVFLSMLTLLASLVAPIYPQCPNNTGADGNLKDAWPQGSTVYFSFNTNVPPNELDQMRAAFAAWSSENELNRSGVTFVENPPTGPNHVASPQFHIDISQADGNPSPVDGSVPGANTNVSSICHTETTPPVCNAESATVVLHPNASSATFDPDTGDPITPTYGFDFSSTSQGFDSIFEKVMEHEIGHTMGLGDTRGTQQAGHSVMNSIAGTNDRNGNLPTSPQGCDRDAIQNHPLYAQCAAGASAACASKVPHHTFFTQNCHCELDAPSGGGSASDNSHYGFGEGDVGCAEVYLIVDHYWE